MRNTNDELGNQGERFFSWIAARVPGVVLNPSERDRLGWDFIVEWPEVHSTAPRDLNRITSATFVQIKSTTKSSNKVSISLSNLERMLKSESPCFIVLFRFQNDSNESPECFVIHVWGSLLEKVAERLTKEDKAGNSMLHKRMQSISFEPEHKISCDHLLEHIRSEVDRLGDGYSAAKKKHAFQSGAISMKANIIFKSGVTPKQIAEHSVGLTEHLPIEKFHPVTVRFGIERDFPRAFGDGFLSFEPNPQSTGMLVIKDKSGKAAQDLVQLLPSINLGELEDKDHLLRIEGNYISGIMRPFDKGDDKFNFGLVTKKRFTMKEIEQYLKASEILEEDDVEWELYVDGQKLAFGSINMAGVERSDPTRTVEMKKFLQHIDNLVPNYVRPTDFGFTAHEIEAIHETVTISNMFLNGHRLRIVGKEEIDSSDIVFEGLMPFVIPLPRYWLSGAMQTTLTKSESEEAGSCFEVGRFQPMLWELAEIEGDQHTYGTIAKSLIGRIAAYNDNLPDDGVPKLSFSQTFPAIEGVDQSSISDE